MTHDGTPMADICEKEQKRAEMLAKYREYGLFTGLNLFQNVPPKESVIEGILSERDVICISAQAGIGKSILAIQMACNLTTGSDFLDTFRIRRAHNVLYVQSEGDRTETVERLQRMCKGLSLDARRFFHYNTPGLQLNVESHMSAFLNYICEPKVDYDVIFLDPLYTTVKGTLISDETATDWFRQVRRLRHRFPAATIVVIHHDGKDLILDGRKVERGDTDIFGSNFWSAIFSNNYKMRVKGGKHVLDLGKKRSGPDKVIQTIEMKLLHPEPLMYVMDDSQVSETTSKVMAILRGSSDKVYRRLELEEMLEKSKSSVCRTLRLLCDTGKVVSTEVDGIMYYRWDAKHDEAPN